MPIMDELIEALNNIAEEANRINFYKADKCENDMLYLYGVMAFAYASERYCKLPYSGFKKKYDGNDWCYLGNMETGKHRRIGIGTQHSANAGNQDGFSHTSYNAISGTVFRPMMYNNIIDVCIDIVYSGASEDIDSVANAIQDGYIIKKSDGSFL